MLLKRPTRSAPNGLKVAAVGASLIVIGVAWRYTGPKAADTAGSAPAASAASDAPVAQGGSTLVTSVRVSPAALSPAALSPAALTREASLALPAAPGEPEPSAADTQPAPQVRPLVAEGLAAAEVPTAEVAHSAAVAPRATSTKRHALRPAAASSAARAPSTRPSAQRAPLQSAMPVEEFDFGIDEAAAADEGKPQRVIRTTLD